MALSATRCLSLKLEKACILCCVSLLDKLLVVGSTGLVGSKIASLAHGYEFETYNTHNSRPSPFPNSTKLDITDRDATMTLLAKIRPYAIINVAALTNVDYCETHKEEAERDRKSTRLNSSHSQISYAVFCLKKKKNVTSNTNNINNNS